MAAKQNGNPGMLVGKDAGGTGHEKCFLFVALGIYLSLSPSKALADPFTVDQTNPWDACSAGCLGVNVQYFSPMGQSFTPSLPSLDDVQIVVSPATLGPLPSDLELEIRAGTIAGPILGTASDPSYTSAIPPFEGFSFAHFDFGPSIALTPGSLCVIDVIAPTTSVFLEGQGGGNPYPGGTAIEFGMTQPAYDFYFSEGPVPEPSPVVLLASAAGAAMWFHRRRHRTPSARHRGNRGRPDLRTPCGPGAVD